MESIKQVLMRRDNLSPEEADSMIEGAKMDLEEVLEGGGGICEAEDVIMDWFGLEPDYLMELLP